jgi:replicative DNA helicase
MSELILPEAREIERFVLGAMIQSGHYPHVAAVLEESDFSLSKHRLIFAAVRELYDSGKHIDYSTLAHLLRENGQLESIDGLSYLVSLDEGTPLMYSLDSWLQIVASTSRKRQAMIAAHKFLQDCMSSSADEAVGFQSQCEQILRDLSSQKGPQNLRHVSTIIERAGGLNSLLGQRDPGIPSPWSQLNSYIGGFRPGQMIVIGARPGVGKTAAAGQIAIHAAESSHTTAFFSLEMSESEIFHRLVCGRAGVDSLRARRGMCGPEERHALARAASELQNIELYIDDTTRCTATAIHAALRRLSAERTLGLVVVDYLGLMSSPGRTENRNQEISQISRSLKLAAKEFAVPFIVLAQLNRSSTKEDREPRLDDLRDSGCLTGDTRVTTSSGAWVPIESLVGKQGYVCALDGGFKSVIGKATRVWKTGTREVFEVKTRSGRVIQATSNHPFQTISGFVPLADLSVGDHLAVMRSFPEPLGDHPVGMNDEQIILLAHMIGDGCCAPRQPLHYTSASTPNLDAVERAAFQGFGVRGRRVQQKNWWHLYLSAGANKWHPNPIKTWLSDLGIADKRSYEKFVPTPVFSMPREKVALFLRHLWATDGCAHFSNGRASIYYATTSHRLALDVQELLMRFGVLALIRTTQKPAYRPCYQVHIQGLTGQRRFSEEIGIYGDRSQPLARIVSATDGKEPNTNWDVVPKEVWAIVKALRSEQNISQRHMSELRGKAYNGTASTRFNPSRDLVAIYANLLRSSDLSRLAHSDVFWDRIVSITPKGLQDVYDMSVDSFHNFVANGFVVHNSIEQDADVVLFLHRQEPRGDMPVSSPNEVKLIVAKQRSGPRGAFLLQFQAKYARFVQQVEGEYGAA